MKKRLILILVVLSLLAAACGGGGAATTAGATDTTAATGGTVGVDPSKPTINLAVNPWTASLSTSRSPSNSSRVTSVIRSKRWRSMRTPPCSPEWPTATSTPCWSYWPSGITDDEQAFLDEGTVVDIGNLGAVGKIGWFVPQYVIDEHPDLATWEGFQDPANAALFATAETGDMGRFLGTDPSYSQYDEAIISNLELPFQVVFSGSEAATVAELDARAAAEEPIVMYWWTPTAAVAKYDLVNVPLPGVFGGLLRRSGCHRLRLPRGCADQGGFGAVGREGP